MSVKTIGCIDLATPDLTIGGIASIELDPGIQRWKSGSGGVDHHVAATMAVVPQSGFATYDLSTVISLLAAGGAVFADMDIFEFLYDDCGEIKPGAVHPVTTLASGLIVPQSLAFSGQDPALATLRAYGVSLDGTTAPISTKTGSVPANAVQKEGWALDSISFKGSAVSDITQMNFAFGLTVDHRAKGGKLYPTKAVITARDPILTFTTEDAAAHTIFGHTGQNGAASLVFKKLSDTGRGTSTLTLGIPVAHAVMQGRNGQHRGLTGTPIEIVPLKGEGAIYTAVIA